MKFVLKPSLEHMALFKIVISLWNGNDVRYLMMNLGFPSYFSPTDVKWREIEGRVIKKVPQLPLPQLLKEKVIDLIKPIGLEIKEWMEFHCMIIELILNLPVELSWTSQGTLDRKRTGEMLVRNENLDISTRYKLACIYCLENDIIELWNSMPEDLKKSVVFKSQIVNFWSLNMKKMCLGNADIDYKDEFRKCIKDGNKVAAEYFLRKLTPREKEESLVETAKNVTDDDVLYFLISEMNEDQQMEIFKIIPYRVLRCFLQWPFQSFYIGVANCMWEFLSKDNYYYALRDITFKVRDGYKDWDYQKLFREFWQESPIALKRLITNEIDKSWLLTYLFDIKDKANIRLILKDTTFTIKEKLIYSYRMNLFCECYVRDNEWDLLKFFIQECLPSKKSMLKFKEEFEKRNKWDNVEDNLARNRQKWEELFCLSDGSIWKYDKRSPNEEKTFTLQQELLSKEF